jgi:predicted TIM-barrel fold metal-dependent hydrolase
MVIDADAHVIETERTWDYLEPHEHKFRPQIVQSTTDPNTRYWLINGKIAGLRTAATSDEQFAKTSKSALRNVGASAAARKMEDIDLRLDHMTQLGIDIEVLHHSLWIEQVTNRPDIEVALCRSWNRWLADIWRAAQGRLRWTCVVPTLDLEASKDELRFAKANGCVGVCMQPYIGDLMMLDPYFFPIYELCEELDLAVIVHIANGNPDFVDIVRTRYAKGAGFSAFRAPTVIACFELLQSDLPATFPKIRWGFVETSAQWVPWLIHEVARRNGEKFTPDHNPFADKNIYVTTQTDDDHAYLMEKMGEDNLVIGTDYGHADTSSELDAIGIFRQGELSEVQKNKILITNPARLYGI